MRCFLLGFAGVLVALALLAVILPQYSDYTEKSETSTWLTELRPYQREVEVRAMATGTLQGVAKRVPLPPLYREPFVVISENSWVVVQGRERGQLLLMMPEFNAGKLRWRCVAGNPKASPSQCRGMAAYVD